MVACGLVLAGAISEHCLLHPLVLAVTRTISHCLLNLFLLLLSDARPQALGVAVIEVNRLEDIRLLVQYFGFVELSQEFRVSKVGLFHHGVLEELEGVLVLFSLHAINCFDQFKLLRGDSRVQECANSSAYLLLYNALSQSGFHATPNPAHLAR